MRKIIVNKKYFKSELFNSQKIEHAFFTRNGGVSTGLLKSFNFAFSAHNNEIDSEKNVIKNKKIAANFFAIESSQLKLLHQIHSSEVMVINDKNLDVSQIKADALVTNLKNVVLAVKTADCCPVLLADSHTNVIAAIHVGWRGAFKEILENTIDEMLKLGANAENIKAVIGPAIEQKSYEVNSEFYQKFTNASPANEKFFIASYNANHYLFDLKKYVSHRLAKREISEIKDMKVNTYDDEENFFSCRRAYHKKEPYFGCQLSAIMLK